MRSLPKNIFRVVATVAVMLFSHSLVHSQTDDAEQVKPRPGQNRVIKRPNLLRELNLRPDQLDAIRKYNAERKPMMQAAQKKVADTKRELDKAAYAEVLDENAVNLRFSEHQNARLEIARLRLDGELFIRKLLDADQLKTFSTLKQNFDRRRQQINERQPIRRNLKRRMEQRSQPQK